MNWDSKFAGFMALCGGAAVKFLGGWDILIYSLITFMVIDFLLGLAVAWMNGEISASIGMKGAYKKILILVLVGVGVVLDGVLSTPNVIRSMIILWYLSFEGISIIENAGLAGLPVPDKLKEKLLMLRDDPQK
ncbi:MAG: holin [Clostridia bacterium]|nr:holin [Clostridia bacterium]